jgi:hypothetical protein
MMPVRHPYPRFVNPFRNWEPGEKTGVENINSSVIPYSMAKKYFIRISVQSVAGANRVLGGRGI